MKRVARPLVKALKALPAPPILGLLVCLGTAPGPSVRFRDRPAGAAAPEHAARPAPSWGYSTIPAHIRCARRSASLPTRWRPPPTASTAPRARSRCACRSCRSSCMAPPKACRSPAPPKARPSRTSSPDRRASTSTRRSTRHAIGPSSAWQSPSASAGVFKVSPKPVADVIKLSAQGHVYNHRLPSRPAEVAADAQHRLRRAARFRRRRLVDDPPRFRRSRPAAAAHLRHGRRLVGLAAARRRAEWPGGRRHQRRHLRAVEGDHAQRRGRCTASSRTTSPIPASTRSPSRPRSRRSSRPRR